MKIPITQQEKPAEFTWAYYEQIESLYHNGKYPEFNKMVSETSKECKKDMLQYFLCYLSPKTPRKHVNFYQYLLLTILPTL